MVGIDHAHAAPLVRYVFTDRDNAPVVAGTNRGWGVIQPPGASGVGAALLFDALADFSQRDHADEEFLIRHALEPLKDTRISTLADFRARRDNCGRLL